MRVVVKKDSFIISKEEVMRWKEDLKNEKGPLEEKIEKAWKRYKKAKGRPIQIMETYDKFINLEKTHELFYGNKYAFNNETQGFDYSKVKHKHIKNKKL